MRYPRIFQSIAILALLILPTVARADEIALWNFNDPPATLVVDRGTGTLTTTANPANVTNFGGTTLNARMGDPAGQALAIQGGTSLQNNGSILELRASTAGFTNIVVSWAWQRSDTGFNSILLQFSNDGTTFQDLSTLSPATNTFGTVSVAFNAASGTFNNPNFAFRWVLNGASNALGNVRYDNLVVEGTPSAVPEPATMLLLGTGLAGVAAKVRRRRKANKSNEA